MSHGASAGDGKGEAILPQQSRLFPVSCFKQDGTARPMVCLSSAPGELSQPESLLPSLAEEHIMGMVHTHSAPQPRAPHTPPPPKKKKMDLEVLAGSPPQYSCLENSMDRGAWQATVHGVSRVPHDLATKSNHRYKMQQGWVKPGQRGACLRGTSFTSYFSSCLQG